VSFKHIVLINPDAENVIRKSTVGGTVSTPAPEHCGQ